MEWPIEAWAASMRASHRAESTIDRRTYHVRVFAEEHPDPWAVTRADVEERLGRCRAPEYAKSIRASLHVFYVWAVRQDLTVVDPTIGLDPIKVPRPRARPCPDRVVAAAAMRAPDDVRLMVMLGAQAGLRRAEIAAVHSDHIDGEYLWVTGKGGITRVVKLTEALQVELAALEDGWAFPGRWGGHAQPDTVGRKVRRALGGPWTAHSLRHRFATKAYNGTRNLLAVQQALGHASSVTTQRYVRVDEDALGAIAAAVA